MASQPSYINIVAGRTAELGRQLRREGLLQLESETITSTVDRDQRTDVERPVFTIIVSTILIFVVFVVF